MQLLQDAVGHVGPEVALNKCGVVPAHGLRHCILAESFHGFQWCKNKDFKLLGTPCGSKSIVMNACAI